MVLYSKLLANSLGSVGEIMPIPMDIVIKNTANRMKIYNVYTHRETVHVQNKAVFSALYRE